MREEEELENLHLLSCPWAANGSLNFVGRLPWPQRGLAFIRYRGRHLERGLPRRCQESKVFRVQVPVTYVLSILLY